VTEMIEPVPGGSIRNSSPATWWNGPAPTAWNLIDPGELLSGDGPNPKAFTVFVADIMETMIQL
jgi:hypothetical protein